MTRKGRKLDTYQVCVTIIEARHLELNSNPMVVVRVGNRKKKTPVRKTTDSPYYNEVYYAYVCICMLTTRISLIRFRRAVGIEFVLGMRVALLTRIGAFELPTRGKANVVVD